MKRHPEKNDIFLALRQATGELSDDERRQWTEAASGLDDGESPLAAYETVRADVHEALADDATVARWRSSIVDGMVAAERRGRIVAFVRPVLAVAAGLLLTVTIAWQWRTAAPESVNMRPESAVASLERALAEQVIFGVNDLSEDTDWDRVDEELALMEALPVSLAQSGTPDESLEGTTPLAPVLDGLTEWLETPLIDMSI